MPHSQPPWWAPTVHGVVMVVVMTAAVSFLFSLNITTFDDERQSIPWVGAALAGREALRYFSGGKL